VDLGDVVARIDLRCFVGGGYLGLERVLTRGGARVTCSATTTASNDSLYGYGVQAFLERCGIREVRTAYRSPWQNPYVERFIGTLRRELLDHVIVLSQSHLHRILREYIEEYYHVARPHQGLDGDTPMPHETSAATAGPTKLVSIPVVGGLHHRYSRVAA